MTRSPPNFHTMVHTWSYIQDVLKVTVKVKGHVIRTLFWCDENRFFYHKHDWIATTLAHDGPHVGLHPGCAQGQVKVKGHVIWALLWCHEMFAIQYLLTFCLYMHSLYEALLHSPSSTSVRQLHRGMSYSVIDGLVLVYWQTMKNVTFEVSDARNWQHTTWFYQDVWSNWWLMSTFVTNILILVAILSLKSHIKTKTLLHLLLRGLWLTKETYDNANANCFICFCSVFFTTVLMKLP